ncbi:MAG TPA: hypothetical protein VKY36_03275 [Moheibacter sp.]|nr:hypothetical protein [Moheibacter sp.]
MNVWLESLNEILEKSYLDEFDEIYYLSSTKVVDESVISQAIEASKLKDFLIKNNSDVNEDLLDFFLLVNEEKQDVLVVYSPFELFENESIYVRAENVQENFSDFPEIEPVK